MNKSIKSRLEKLEKNMLRQGKLPKVVLRYEDGSETIHGGFPPIENIMRGDNPAVLAYGSEFADMVNLIMHPVPNRNIEELEQGQITEEI